MQDAIILGGGISGLTAGYQLQKRGLDLSIIEKNVGPGGPISTLRSQGYLVERGPNSLLLSDPWVESLLNELGLADQVLETRPQAKKRYIVKNGRPVSVPSSPLQAIATPLFSLRAKLGFLGEPFRSRISDQRGDAETVASFVRRRMGQEFLDYAIDPFVSGVYAGDPKQLVLDYAFPLIRGFERDHGSLVRGALALKRRRKREGAAYKKRSISFREGLGALPATLARKLGNRVWLESKVVAVNRMEDCWQVTWKRQGENFEGFARHLLVCLPAYAIKRLAWTSDIANPLQEAPDLPFPPVHSLALGFRREQIEHPLDGFGVLAPSKEPTTILGALFSSSLFPDRAPDQHALLTTMIGGIRQPESASFSQEKLLEIALSDLKPLLGISGDPAFVHLSSWPRAIPQYTAAYGSWRNTLHGLEDEFPSLHFGGSSVDGIAMGAAILSGKRLAANVEEANQV